MEEVLSFLQANETLIYIVVGVVGIFYLRRLFRSWREFRSATFGLERESVQKTFNTSLAIVVILGMIALGEFIVVSFVAPTVPRRNIGPTPTMDILAGKTETPEIPAVGTNIPEVILTATPEVLAVGCVTGQLEWLSPTPGARVNGRVSLRGLVRVTNLGFYKYEFNRVGTENWTTIAADTSETFDATWDVSNLEGGEYQLRILASDAQNNEFPACIITININNP